VYFLRHKYEFFEHLKDLKAHEKTQSKRKIKILCIENGGEYVNQYFHDICLDAGI
jgi:hypothetical protein